MIKSIIQYPTQTGFDFGGVVRHFDEQLLELIQDLKDTIQEHKLEGLSAFQIGSPLNVVVVKDKDNFIELINPAILTKEGEIHPTESTAYFPNLSATTKRAQKIKVMYENNKGKQQFLTAENELAIVIQRKTDYLLGSTFLARLDSQEKQLFEKKLTSNSNNLTLESCPTTLHSDKILRVIKGGIILGVIGVLSSFILQENVIHTLKLVENILMLLLAGLIILYFFYAQWEGKKYNSCTSCQIGNISAMTVIKSIHLLGLLLLNYWLL